MRANLYTIWLATQAFAAMMNRHPEHSQDIDTTYNEFLVDSGWTPVEVAQALGALAVEQTPIQVPATSPGT